jgi:hypothetical protein
VYKTHTLSTFIHKVLLRSEWGLIFIPPNSLIYIPKMKTRSLALFLAAAQKISGDRGNSLSLFIVKGSTN